MKQIATLALALLLLIGLLISNIPVYAQDDKGGSSDGGGDESGDGGGSDDSGRTVQDPVQNPIGDPVEKPIEDPTIIPEEQPIECPKGTELRGTECERIMPPIGLGNELPVCDGTPQDCITNDGNVCLEGQGGHECECEEDMSDCPLHPSLQPPLDSPSPKPLPYCDLVEDDPEYTGACHDRKDFDDITKLYPCNDGTQEKDWRDCEDAYKPPPKPCDPTTDQNCEEKCPENQGICVKVCKDGYVLIDGKCDPKPEKPKCPPGWEYREKQDDCHKEITIIINKIIKETNEGKHQDGFPDVDIIGLSVKQSGDAMICAMDIDSDHIECQEFGIDPQKVNQDFWRVIETDSDKNYDDGNTGSNDIDDAIDAIKSQDFSELDDLDNHNFGIDLAWVAINPQGEGVTCLTADQSGKGKSLCEPFKVSSQDVDGQITEGVEFF